MLSNKNGNTNTLARFYYVDLKKKRRKPISFKFAYQGRKVMGTFCCSQTKPEIKHFVCSCQVLNVADLFVFAGTNWENPVPESSTKILTV